LTSKLDRVLLFLGINDCDQEQTTGDKPSVIVDETTTVNIQPSNSTNYAEVTRRHLALPQPRQLSDVVLTAIHSEQIDKDRRNKSVIVNGLPSNPGEHDADSFRRICSSELGSVPNIARVGRLGTSTNRVRPLLVTLRSSVEATDLVERSKAVDRGANRAMRDIYINPNLSKTEAKLAYEERCRRRLAAQRQNGRRNANSPVSRNNGIDPVHDQPASSTLNPSAAVFSSVQSGVVGGSHAAAAVTAALGARIR